ncbi:MAG: hypothetical protein EOP73_01725 [Variovorax sp.]|nr:MAG: hypothetical protein EOP73_01725 [Variovorax sp.]
MAEVAPLAGRAVGAGLWTVGTRLAAKVVDLAMLLCLARFLRPAEFGLVGRPAGLERHVAGVAHRFFARTRRIPRAADDAPAAPSRRPPPTQPATATEGHVEPPR